MSKARTYVYTAEEQHAAKMRLLALCALAWASLGLMWLAG